jgi:hypothetical protein
MKKAQVKRHLFIFLLGFIISCSGNKRDDHLVSSPDNQPGKQQVKQERGRENQYYIRDKSNNTVGLIDLDYPVTIKWRETSINRVVKGDKSKYRNGNNENIYEIKYSDEGFKLRNDDGRLLWKVKYKESRLKISDNEEMTSAFEIKQDGQAAEIKKDQKPVQSIDLGSSSVPVMINTSRETFTIAGPSKNLSLAILAIEDIPADQQLILVTEILLSGK